jgi:hypothetical protein
MWALIVAAVCAGLFAGAAIYITAVEHPARLSCGTELALREFAAQRYRRATAMQVPLAIMGCLTGLWSAWVLGDALVGLEALLLGAVVPFTLIVILPTNRDLGARATALLIRWGRLHLIRSVFSSVALVLFVVRLGAA